MERTRVDVTERDIERDTILLKLQDTPAFPALTRATVLTPLQRSRASLTLCPVSVIFTLSFYTRCESLARWHNARRDGTQTLTQRRELSFSCRFRVASNQRWCRVAYFRLSLAPRWCCPWQAGRSAPLWSTYMLQARRGKSWCLNVRAEVASWALGTSFFHILYTPCTT